MDPKGVRFALVCVLLSIGTFVVPARANTPGSGAGFDASLAIPVAANPAAVGVADFDADGAKDLAVPSYTGSTVTILSGPDGTFRPVATYPTGRTPIAVSTQDLNADRWPDLAVANYGSNDVSVFLNDGRGALSLRTTVRAGTQPHAVEAADLDRDGANDLVVTNFGSANVSVFRGDGTGGFAAPRTFTAAAGARMSVVTDLNADARADLAVANYNASTVSILLGDGTGGFGTKSDVAVAGNPVALAATDLDANGTKDLVSANYARGTVSVLSGSGTGAFSTGATVTVGANPVAIAARDVNADTKPDAVVVNYGSQTVTVLTGSGTGALAVAATYPVGVEPYALALETLDGDTNADLAVANFGSSSVSILRGLGTARFTSAPSVSTGANPVALASGDLDRDGNRDVVVARSTAASLGVMLADGRGGFAAPVAYTVGTSPRAVALGDLTKDGLLDAAVANNGSDTLSVLTGDGAGRFGAARATAVGSRPSAIAIGDLDRDGVNDVVVANEGASSVVVMKNQGASKFKALSTRAVGTAPRALALGDVNGDGALDAVTANGGAASASVLLNDRTGRLGVAATYTAGTKPAAVVLAHLDADAQLDLAVANEGSNSITVRSGSGTGTFGVARTVGVSGSPLSLAAADLDADNATDLIVALTNANAIGVLSGDGAGGFGAARAFGVERTPAALVVGRFNADDRTDAIVANYGSNSASVLFGTAGVSWTPSPPPPPPPPATTWPAACTPVDGDWSRCVTTEAPTAAAAPAMAYDPVNRNAVLFGGCKTRAFPKTTVTFGTTTNLALNTGVERVPNDTLTTWTSASSSETLKPFCLEQSGETWTLRDGRWSKHDVAGPHPRWYSHMSFDKTTGWVILFGGLYTAVDQPVAPAGSRPCFGNTRLLKQWPADSDPRRFEYAYTPITSVTAADSTVAFDGKPINAYCFNDTWAWTGSEWKQLKAAAAPTPRFDGAVASDHTTVCTAANVDGCSTSSGLVTLFGGCQFLGLMGNHGDTSNPHHWECTRFASEYGSNIYITNRSTDQTRANPCETSGDVCARRISIGETWEWRGNLGGTTDVNGNHGTWVNRCPSECAPMKTACKDGYDAAGNWINAPGVDWDSQSFCAPFQRTGSTMTYNPRTQAYELMGGWYYDPQWVYNGIHGDSWEWRPTGTCTTDAGTWADNGKSRAAPCWQNVFSTWKKANWSSPQPKNRAWGSAATAPIGGRWQQVIFGGHGIVDGRNAGALADPWTWRDPDGCTDGNEIYDKTCWEQLSSSLVPPSRRNASMVYDVGARTVVLFGGVCDPAFDATCTSGVRTDTWLYRPSS